MKKKVGLIGGYVGYAWHMQVLKKDVACYLCFLQFLLGESFFVA